MASWNYARIDRVDSGVVHCHFCNRPLPSGKVVVLSQAEGPEVFSGPGCAKKHLGEAKTQVLDLSKLALLVIESDLEQSESEGAPKPRKKSASNPRSNRDAATEYLRIRIEAMRGFSGRSTDKLKECYADLHSKNELSKDGRLYIERLMAKAASTNTIYSHRNIKCCVGVAYWIKVAREQTPASRQGFLNGLDSLLKQHWRLSVGQMEGLNSWGKGIRLSDRRFPSLDVNAFAEVKARTPTQDQKRLS